MQDRTKYFFKPFCLLTFTFLFWANSIAQLNPYKVVAYMSSDSASLQRYNLKKITHLIYSFANLDSNGLIKAYYKKDTVMLHAVKQAKKKYPTLKTMIALGGWGGCPSCSETFATDKRRKAFAKSVKKFIDYFQLDGIDLDWEYPTIEGPPGHLYQPQDKQNFTKLLQELRAVLGKNKLITFAAGGFKKYLQESVDWDQINPLVDFVNLMTYDLVHGYSTETGHQSALYSVRPQDESINNCVQYFKKIKFPLYKIIVGVPFYLRFFQVQDTSNLGLFKPTRFIIMKGYQHIKDSVNTAPYIYKWDDIAKVPYWLDTERKIFVTGDNNTSLQNKINYIKKNKLGGMMFWELSNDAPDNGLLDVIHFK